MINKETVESFYRLMEERKKTLGPKLAEGIAEMVRELHGERLAELTVTLQAIACYGLDRLNKKNGEDEVLAIQHQTMAVIYALKAHLGRGEFAVCTMFDQLKNMVAKENTTCH